jgi:hypothetical protein
MAAAANDFMVHTKQMWWSLFTMMGAFGLAHSGAIYQSSKAISLLESSVIWSLQRG